MRKILILALILAWGATEAIAAPPQVSKPVPFEKLAKVFPNSEGSLCTSNKGKAAAALLGANGTVQVFSARDQKRIQKKLKRMRSSKRKAALRKQARSAKAILSRCKRDLPLAEQNLERGERLPFPECIDFNNDLRINSNDISSFLSAFLNGQADFNGDGVTTSQDLSQFLQGWIGAVNGTYQCQETPPPAPTATPTPTPPVEYVDECSDGIDNDNDGFIDGADRFGLTEGALGASLGCDGPNRSETMNDSGFTLFTKSNDSRVVYVSALTGNDANSGLDRDHPVRTIGRGYSLLRSGYPDWLLIKRDEIHTTGQLMINKSGRSESERMLIGAYGSGARPRIQTGSATFIGRNGGSGNGTTGGSHLAITGIAAIPHTRAVNSNPLGISWVGGGRNLLIEDCLFERFGTAIAIQSDSSANPQNLKVRRNVLIDSHTTGAHSQGMYLWGVLGGLIEENILDYNGWNAEAGAAATIFNHNMYLGTANVDMVTRGNIVSRGSSHGIQQRSGGLVEGNLSVRNSIGILLGGGDPTTGSHTHGVSGEVRGNVILEGKDITPALPRGAGMDITNIGLDGAVIEDNIIAHKLVNNSGGAFSFIGSGYGAGVGVNNTLVQRNIIYNWRGASTSNAPASNPPSPSAFSSVSGNVFRQNQLQEPFATNGVLLNIFTASSAAWQFAENAYFSGASGGARFVTGGTTRTFEQWRSVTNDITSQVLEISYPDPSRSVASYHASLGREATFDAFIAQARLQSRGAWRNEYTARAVTNYIRAGFGLPPH